MSGPITSSSATSCSQSSRGRRASSTPTTTNGSGSPKPRRGSARRLAAKVLGVSLLGLTLGTLGCGGQGNYTWYTQIPQSEWGAANNEYVLAVGDSINIRVFGQEAFSASGKIRTDGRVSLP